MMENQRDNKIILVGELNPYGADPYYALYPAPDGCSGHRLCCKIFGLHRKTYLDLFERVNLCEGKWSLPKARERAKSLWENPGKFVLLGSKVCAAWPTLFLPFTISDGGTTLVLPHPSGLCRMWSDPSAVELTRAKMVEFAPELVSFIGQTAIAEPSAEFVD